MNDVRAIRLAEIVGDYRRLQHRILQVDVHPTPQEYYGEGHLLLRQCLADAQNILQTAFSTSPSSPDGNIEQEKLHLQQ